MEYELILPAHMSLAEVADRVTRAVRDVLASSRDTRDAARADGPIAEAVEEYLMNTLRSEVPMGGVRSLRFSGESNGPGEGLEAELTRAIARRVHEVFKDVRAVQLVTHDLPEAIHGALDAYLWSEPERPARGSAPARPGMTI